jgi:uncharacterized membrane protein YvbJ
MSQYSRTQAQQRGEAVGSSRICAECGQAVAADDRYCSGCGAAFAGAPARVERKAALPGFQYHLIQGLGWGLGLALAAGIVALIFYGLAALAFALVIHAAP